MSSLRCPSFVLLCAVLTACSVLVWWLSEDDRSRVDRLASARKKASYVTANLEARVQFLEFLHRVRRVEITLLTERLTSLLRNKNGTATASSKTINSSRSRDDCAGLTTTVENVERKYLPLFHDKPSLQLPSVYHFLPHLLDHSSSLQPSVWLSRGRSGVSIALGILTMRPDHVEYSLIQTLRNMFNNMSPQEADDTLVVVLIDEIDRKYVEDVCKQLRKHFAKHVESGLLDVVSPPAAYYPDTQYLDPYLEESPGSAVRRSKRNLDIAFLMMYSQEKGTFYVQLNDYMYSKKHFIRTMKNYAFTKCTKKSSWLTIDFSQMGIIMGKLFKAVDLPRVINFFLMFHDDKPPLSLLNYLIRAQVCRKDEPLGFCKGRADRHMIKFPLTIFYKNISQDFPLLEEKLQKPNEKHFVLKPLK